MTTFVRSDASAMDATVMAMPYDDTFFSLVADHSVRNARIVVPLVMDLLSPKSVLDVGCGPGAWLRAFKENGVGVICGIDGDYIDRSKLLIEDKHFYPTDLSQPFTIDREYDLALCIEVAEHLPATHARTLIEQLTTAAPVVLFSAAIPGQGGTNHVNEQWPPYWRKRFAERDWGMLDPFRPRIRDDPRIAWYIRQNLVLFASRAWLESHPTLRRQVDDANCLDGGWVHANLYESWFERANAYLGVRELVSRLPSAMRRSIVRRLKRNWVS
jgi:SAM-dependent methyltransferase